MEMLTGDCALSCFQAEDGIRDRNVTGVQTCALPILRVARFTRATLSPGLSWWDVLAVAALGGIGFTVSLLIGDLAFGAGTARDEHVKAAILLASGLAALLGAGLRSWRGRHP